MLKITPAIALLLTGATALSSKSPFLKKMAQKTPTALSQVQVKYEPYAGVLLLFKCLKIEMEIRSYISWIITPIKNLMDVLIKMTSIMEISLECWTTSTTNCNHSFHPFHSYSKESR